MNAIAINNIIDLQRYPIDQLDTADGEAFLATCKQQLQDGGAVALEEFINKESVADIIENLEPKLDDAYFCNNQHNVYLIPDDPDLPEDHPRNRKVFSDKGLLAYDQIPMENLLRQIYDWPPLREFIARLMDNDALYPYVDNMAPINININGDNRQLGWHYDNTRFVTTMMLRPAESGGAYEYIPWTRSDDEQNFDTLDSILNDTYEDVLELKQDAGTFVLFKGQYTLHRVTPSEGEQPRLIAILSYGEEPGKTLTPETQRIFYGREVQ